MCKKCYTTKTRPTSIFRHFPRYYIYKVSNGWNGPQELSPVSIQTQSNALRALHKRKPQETLTLALASSQSWLPLLRPSITIGWRLRLLRENFTQAFAFLAVFDYILHHR